MKVNCPKCNQKYNIDSTLYNKDIDCSKCSHVMNFPAPKEDTKNTEKKKEKSVKNTPKKAVGPKTTPIKKAATSLEPIKFHCPECNQKYKVTPDLFGKEIDCTKCSVKMKLPSPQQKTEKPKEVEVKEVDDEKESLKTAKAAPAKKKKPAQKSGGATKPKLSTATPAKQGVKVNSPAKKAGKAGVLATGSSTASKGSKLSVKGGKSSPKISKASASKVEKSTDSNKPAKKESDDPLKTAKLKGKRSKGDKKSDDDTPKLAAGGGAPSPVRRARRYAQQSSSPTGLIAAAVIGLLAIGGALLAINNMRGGDSEDVVATETTADDLKGLLGDKAGDSSSAKTTRPDPNASATNLASSKGDVPPVKIKETNTTEAVVNTDPPSNAEKQVLVIKPADIPLASDNNVEFTKLSVEEMKSGFNTVVAPYFKKNCIECHGPDKEKGDLRVDLVMKSIGGDYAMSHWQNIIDEIAVDNMPPEEKPRPSSNSTTAVIDNIASFLDFKKKGSTPGGRPARRITRTEFANIAEDFFGVKINHDDLPEDLHIGDFETDVEYLAMSDLLVENYMKIARDIADEFVDNRNKAGTKAHEFFSSLGIANEKNPPDTIAANVIARYSVFAKRGRVSSDSYSRRLKIVFDEQRRKRNLPFWEAIKEPLSMTMFSVDSLFLYEEKNNSKFISGLDLANRMSFALWRSAPDAELIKLGRSDELLQPEVRKAQMVRMMKDSRFNRFITDFTDQWLELRRQDEIAVEDLIYTKFDPSIKVSMKRETIEFYKHLVNNNLPITNFIDSDFMVLNEEMAKFYGIKGVKGKQFRPVKRTNTSASNARGGVITNAGILMQGGMGDRSSIIERGAWIARKIINDPPSDPPPNVEEVPTSGNDFLTKPAIDLLHAHANIPTCANCHNKIDPLGVPLESYDAIGQLRKVEKRLKEGASEGKGRPYFEVPLKTVGVYYNGEKFSGVLDLKKALMARRDGLGRAYVEALISYTNGRKAGLADSSLIDEILSQTHDVNYPAREIIEKIILSDMMISH